jgi:hypothetical protein
MFKFKENVIILFLLRFVTSKYPSQNFSKVFEKENLR